MGYRLKSDVAVNDPDGLFDMVFTEYGIATKSMQDFQNGLYAQGYSITKDQFNALAKFEQTLKENSIWGNVLEVIPLIGDSINAMTVKFKGKNSNTMDVLGGMNASNLESNKGVNFSLQLATGAMGFNTKLKKSDIINNYGLTVYGRIHGADPSYESNYFGISNGTLKIRNAFFSSRMAQQQFFQSNMQQPNAVPSGQEFRLTSNLRTNNSYTVDRRIYNGTELKISSLSEVALTPFNEDGDLYLGCENHIVNGAINGYYGRLRMCIINDGRIPMDNLPIYLQACETLFVELGKSAY